MVFRSEGSSAACNVVEVVVKLVRYALTSNPTTKHPCAASRCATCGPRWIQPPSPLDTMTGRALVTPYRWTDCTWPRTGTRSVLCAEASSARETGQQPRTIAHAVHRFRMTSPRINSPTPNSQGERPEAGQLGAGSSKSALLLCGLGRLRCFGVHGGRH